MLNYFLILHQESVHVLFYEEIFILKKLSKFMLEISQKLKHEEKKVVHSV
jgi:hypothetical protein